MSIASPYSIFPGQAIRLKTTVTDMTAGGALTDPTTLSFRVQAPGADTSVVYTYGVSARVKRSSLGVYTLDIVPNLGGVWRWRVETSGNIESAYEDTFTVQPSAIADSVPETGLDPENAIETPGATTRGMINGEASALAIGTPVYVFSAGTVKKARANALPSAYVIGLVYTPSVAAGVSGLIVTDGTLEATTAQWDAVTGQTGGLTAGAMYFLDQATAGKLTPAAPTTSGQYLVRVGIALSATVLEISIQEEVLL